MITPGMYSAAKGMLGYIEQNDVIANNIANVNTTGFKKSSLIFKNIYNNMVEQADRTGNPKYRQSDVIGEISVGAEYIPGVIIIAPLHYSCNLDKCS